MNDMDEATSATILRLQRMHRGIEKMRLERAFLLEQLAKRTSTKADDSEGSPSPPPTVRDPYPPFDARFQLGPSSLRPGRDLGNSFSRFASSSLIPSNMSGHGMLDAADKGVP